MQIYRKKKSFKTKKRTSKFYGPAEDIIKLPKNFLHLGLCELRRDRIKNWTKEFKYGNKTYVQFGPESLNMYDKTILFDILRAFNDIENKEFQIKKSEELLEKAKNNDKKALTEIELIDKKGKEDGEIMRRHNQSEPMPYYSFNTIQINYDYFCRKYVGAVGHSKENVWNSLERLLLTKTICKEKEGDKLKEFKPFHYLVDFTLHNNIATFTVSTQLRESTKNGLSIHYNTFKAIKTNIGKALYLLLISNKNKTFSYITIKNALGLSDEEFKNIALIKEGLEALKDIKFIKEYEILNKNNGLYYTIKYNTLDLISVNDGDKIR